MARLKGRIVGRNKRKRVHRKSGGLCHYCGILTVPMVKGHRRQWNGRTIDHLISLACGGSNEDDNLVTACWQCNHAKGLLTPEEFIEHLTAMKETDDGDLDAGLPPMGASA